jgi:hypothetical protein
MHGRNRQSCEPHRHNIRKPQQPRCAQCGAILDRRHVKFKGQPRRCQPCQFAVEMATLVASQPHPKLRRSPCA